MSGSVQVPTSPHRMMGPPRFPTPSQMSHHHSGPHHHGHGQTHRQRMSYQPYRLFPRPPPPGSAGSTPGGGGTNADGSEYDGRRLRKSLVRKTVDYNAAVIKQLQNRVWQRDHRDRRVLEPDYSYAPDTVPPAMQLENSTNAVTTRYVKSATNKMRCPIFSMAWTPEGRRLVTGASSGEFTLWNGLTFNFETILQAHDSPVRSMIWSHNDIWMVTGDHAGYVKYWQSNMNNVKMYQAHKEAIRGLSFSPSDQKFASCSDDGTVRIWDFYTCYEEKVLRGHGADVKCVDWHPHKGILVSGSKDNQQPIKIWDPKAGIPLATIHAHKSTVMDARWNRNGNWLVTASRDHLVKLFDIRKLSQELQIFRGHKKEASCVAWHPIHEDLFATGGSDGSILFWNVGCDKEVGSIEAAHENIIWTLAWHPVGHILCSGSNDHTSKFWTRQKPGDIVRERGHSFHEYSTVDDNDMEEAFIPGMGPEDKVEQGEEEKEELELVIPGLDIAEAEHSTKQEKLLPKKTPYQKPIPKKFQAIWNDSKVEDELEDERDLSRSAPVFTKNPIGPGPGRMNDPNVGPPPPPPPPPMGGDGGFEAFNPNVGFGPMGMSSGIYIGPDRNERMEDRPPPNRMFPPQQQRQQQQGPQHGPPHGPSHGPPHGHGQGYNNNMNHGQEENPFWGGPGPGRGPPHDMRMPMNMNNHGHGGMNRGPQPQGPGGPRGMRPQQQRMRMRGPNPNQGHGPRGGWEQR